MREYVIESCPSSKTHKNGTMWEHEKGLSILGTAPTQAEMKLPINWVK